MQSETFCDCEIGTKYSIKLSGIYWFYYILYRLRRRKRIKSERILIYRWTKYFFGCQSMCTYCSSRFILFVLFILVLLFVFLLVVCHIELHGCGDSRLLRELLQSGPHDEESSSDRSPVQSPRECDQTPAFSPTLPKQSGSSWPDIMTRYILINYVTL